MPNPYHVWLSEIMLQQTTVVTVIPYFHRFITKWPTVQALAEASLDELLAEWAGLGYYRRAHNLYACAQHLATLPAFPQTETELLALRGVGNYTAAAIAAIAFNQPANVVDGNVERVISRLFTIETPLPAAKREIKEKAASLVPRQRAGDYAQALMDLGATICTPRSPKCTLCPLASFCAAKDNTPERYPLKAAKQPRPQRRALVFVLQDKEGHYWMRRRADTGLLSGMLEFPTSPWLESDTFPPLQGNTPVKQDWQVTEDRVKHIFTHFELHLQVITATLKGKKPDGLWLTQAEATKGALPSLMRRVLRLTLQRDAITHKNGYV